MVRRLAALALGTLVLAGCSTMGAGQAATSDEFQIPQSDVDAEVRQVLTALGQPPGEPPVGLALATTQRMVQDALFRAHAAELGVGVTATQVDEALAELAEQNGGPEALEAAALQSGIPADAIEDFVRTNLLFTAIAEVLGPDDAAAREAAARQSLSAYSDRIDLQVAPRYGVWDDLNLQIVPGSPVASPAATQPDGS
jgi:hypothetical protein